MLSLRGWGPAQFQTATPEFLAAARWAMFLEGTMPMYRSAQATLHQEMPADPAGKGAVALAKIEAQKTIAEWTPVLFPEPDDGQ